jgi:hypothetical protein
MTQKFTSSELGLMYAYAMGYHKGRVVRTYDANSNVVGELHPADYREFAEREQLAYKTGYWRGAMDGDELDHADELDI